VHHWPLNGGLACPKNMTLAELAPCNRNILCSNSTDCAVTTWTMWSSAVCSASCGPGQITRTRQVTDFRSGTGQGCNENTVETAPCRANPVCPTVDCAWGVWTQWSECTKTCGGGRSGRNRPIAQHPLHGGKECVASLTEEMKNCSAAVCPSAVCVDGAWGDWAPWEPCSKTCRGGMTWRSRQIATPASECGVPASGLSQELGSCNAEVACMPSVDCKLSDWDTWSDCSASCEGTKRRARRVLVEGQGNGTFCSGALKQASPCNPDWRQPVPAGCSASGAALDCQYDSWALWSACTKSCGGGQRFRNRTIRQMPANGGIGCADPLVLTEGCAQQACGSPCGTTVCIWSAWGPWSPCNRCGGQRSRTRRVSPPTGGGNSCKMRASQETQACPAHCHDKFFCSWSSWQEWSTCSSLCGASYRHQRRELALTSVPAGTTRSRLYETGGSDLDENELQERFQHLWRQSKRDEALRTQELVAAFAAGAFVLLLTLVVVRVMAKPVRNTEYAEAPLLEADEPQVGSLEIE